MPNKAAQFRRTAEHIDQQIGRNEPPNFLFQSLRIPVLSNIQTPSGLRAKCLSAVAPVGYGKTVLMSMLLADLRHAGKQCLWLSLDERDNTVESLINELGSILRGDKNQAHPTQALFHGHEPRDTSIDKLLSILNSHPLAITLFIDNLHFCRDESLGLFLDQLLFKTRANVQIVLSSTEDLPLDYPRAQLEGLVQQIGPKELSFSQEDVTSLFGDSLTSQIGEQGVAEVTRKTEGWPAAVRMAQIILSQAEQPLSALAAFSGSDESLAQLLNRQVLSGFSAELRQFLLAVSQLRTFNMELCSAAIGGDHVAEHLNDLIERNVFVIPLDRNRSWYRLHGLFRDHLLREASLHLNKQDRQDIQLRASAWCQRNQYWRDAINYALDAESSSTAMPILEQIAPSFVRDRGAVLQYIRWIEILHDEGKQVSLEAEYWFVWALAFHRRYEYARKQISMLFQRMQRQQRKPNSAGETELHRRIAILRTSIDSLSDQLEDAYLGAKQWLANTECDSSDSFNLTAANCIVACYFMNTFHFSDARQCLQAAKETAYQTNSTYVDGWVYAYTALVGIHEGNYANTYTEIVSALTTTRGALGDESGICGTMALVAARCAVGMGLDQDAHQLLAFGMKTARTHGFLESAASGLDAAVLLWQGHSDETITLSSMWEVANAYPTRLSLMLSCFLIKRLIVLGHIDEARAEAERAGLQRAAETSKLRGTKAMAIPLLDTLINSALIELELALGRLKPAASLINQDLKRAKKQSCNARQVELELNSAVIATQSQDYTLAVRHITRAVRIAASRRILRPFLDQVEVLHAVISASKASAWGFVSDQERQLFAEICRKLPNDEATDVSDISAINEPPRLLGKLTARELELLSFIAAGLSNQQLADRIDVSLTTVKWHLQNLYGKLGVSSRTAALAKARNLNVLP
ncbi:MAG: LuxR C-terminal-related transcriptional regulator [Zhongshania sp.]|uniref:LuxR C-terminal-related transcriptional regulator n=1 Tax=Zhongshania sp. TaxID=1971902 RepID=UPI00260EBCE5|nr:LuxR C-terminal-related transcriptional regulator [Zhongshania sp.]MDF1690763.1 LuxR C-terminal-related transcriptional regulator [Zhongshania sp.]